MSFLRHIKFRKLSTVMEILKHRGETLNPVCVSLYVIKCIIFLNEVFRIFIMKSNSFS